MFSQDYLAIAVIIIGVAVMIYDESWKDILEIFGYEWVD